MSEKINARWVNDCQGKKDYDSHVVSIDTRYWPEGGGFHIGTTHGFVLSTDPAIRPSATCTVMLRHGDDDYTDIVRQEFEGDSFEEVAAQVEAWAQSTFERIAAAVRREFA